MVGFDFSLLLTSVVSALPAILPAPANMWDVDNIPDMGRMVLEDAEMANLNFPDDEAIEDNNSRAKSLKKLEDLLNAIQAINFYYGFEDAVVFEYSRSEALK